MIEKRRLKDIWTVDDCGDDMSERRILELLGDCECVQVDRHELNYLLIPKTCRKLSHENIEWFNEVYQTIVNDPIPWYPIEWTKEGVSKKTRMPAYGLKQKSHATIELVIFAYYGTFRIIMGKDTSNDDDITGEDSWKEFLCMCARMNVKIEDYAVENGKEIKETIPKAKIDLVRAVPEVTYENAHHLDINSSYPAGMAETYPELYPVINEFYEMRKENKKAKAVLTHAFGWFQSQFCHLNHKGYALAKLSKAAVEVNNRKIDDLTRRLEETGHTILAYNTDGIWYLGDVFHDVDEGKSLGQWKNDHTNCTIRFKSKGAYEFIEDDKVNVVLRGLCALDRIKPDRSTWAWGDIFEDDSDILKIRVNPKIGLVTEEE